MMYEVKIKRKLERQLNHLPGHIQHTFFELVDDLRKSGPVQPSWPNYGKLSDREYHCPLTYRYVACWRYDKGAVLIEVYYVGSREKAPY
ncbi:MAG: type II toxin-antitoxin system RelE/ParE family toxin [Candidatus Omnitrophota bacterium]